MCVSNVVQLATCDELSDMLLLAQARTSFPVSSAAAKQVLNCLEVRDV